jgi:hypothetical protein
MLEIISGERKSSMPLRQPPLTVFSTIRCTRPMGAPITPFTESGTVRWQTSGRPIGARIASRALPKLQYANDLHLVGG